MQIAVLGCGWLGLPLAIHLGKKHIVKGSTTTPGKCQQLQDKGITPYVLDLNTVSEESIMPFLSGTDVLVINIPPRITAENRLTYPEKMERLIPFVLQAGIKKVLFISSTSVYADDATIPVITPDTLPNPKTESGKQVLAAEQVLRIQDSFDTTVIRFAGLKGNGRHPVFHLAGKTGLANPLGPVNLIGLEHCIAVIEAVIEKGVWGNNFIVSESYHPTREEFYTAQAQKFNLPLPQFDKSNISTGKIIKGQDAIARYLGYDSL